MPFKSLRTSTLKVYRSVSRRIPRLADDRRLGRMSPDEDADQDAGAGSDEDPDSAQLLLIDLTAMGDAIQEFRRQLNVMSLQEAVVQQQMARHNYQHLLVRKDKLQVGKAFDGVGLEGVQEIACVVLDFLKEEQTKISALIEEKCTKNTAS